MSDTAGRVRETCNCVFRHAVENGLIKSSENPAIDPKIGGVRTPPVKHYAAITDPGALSDLIRAIRSYKGSPVVRAALQFTPLVFQRPGQVRVAQWVQFDLDQGLWTCPAAMMKGRLGRKRSGPPHLVPLSSTGTGIRECFEGSRFVEVSTSACVTCSPPNRHQSRLPVFCLSGRDQIVSGYMLRSA